MAAYYSNLFMFLFFNLFFNLSNSQNQSASTCDENSNSTLCQLQKRNNLKACIEYENNLLTSFEKDLIIDGHTDLRQTMIEGKENLPRALYMKKLQWNEDLERMAQKWAKTCRKGKDPDLSYNGKPVGQSIITINSGADDQVKNLIGIWSSGLQNVSKEAIIAYRKPREGELDYSPAIQMIWWNTTQIGCGRATYNLTNCPPDTNSSENCTRQRTTKFVCNYFPAGNNEGQSVYIKAEDNNLICQYDDEHMLCKNFTSRRDDSDNYDNYNNYDSYDTDTIIGRIKNRLNGCWPTAARGATVSKSYFFILFILFKSLIQVYAHFIGEALNKKKSV